MPDSVTSRGRPRPYIAYHNGQFVDDYDLRISVFDSALMFGDMVFEMTRSFNRQHFMLREHLERLMNGVRILRIPLDLELSELEEICLKVSEVNEDRLLPTDEHRLMINISRGPLGIYEEVFSGKLEPTVIVADIPLRWSVRGLGKLFEIGINAVVTSQSAIPARYLDPKIKNRSRLFYQMANIEASQHKGDNNWALLLDEHGNIAEGTGDNFFIVTDDSIISPKGKDILRGISRDFVRTLCNDLAIPYLERDIDLYDAYTASEAFMTGTPFCILPVSSINGLPTKTGAKSPLTRSLIEHWSKKVGVDIEAQIKFFNTQTSDATGTTPYRFTNPDTPNT